MYKLSIMQRLLRERALGRYVAALENGDLETLASIMRRAEKDAALEDMIFEVHETYQTAEEFLVMLQEENAMEIEGGIHKSLPGGSEPEPEPLQKHAPGKYTRWLQVLAAVLVVCVLVGSFIGVQFWRASHTPTSIVVRPQQHGWCVVPGPSGFNPNYVPPQLNGIAAISADNAWIVGSYADATLVEHWNGSHWSIVPTPDISSGSSGLYSISALSANDIWAVGATAPGSHFNNSVGIHTLVEHWDGQHWSVEIGRASCRERV